MNRVLINRFLIALLFAFVVDSSFCYLNAMQINPFAVVQKQVRNDGLSEREQIEEDIKILKTLKSDVSKLKGGIANRSQKSMVRGKKLYTLDWTSLEPGETVADTVQIIQNKITELEGQLQKASAQEEVLKQEQKVAPGAQAADVGISSEVKQEVLNKISQSSSSPKVNVDLSKMDSNKDRLASSTKDRPSFLGRRKPTRKPRKGFSEVVEDQGLEVQDSKVVQSESIISAVQDIPEVNFAIVALKNTQKFDASENYYDVLGIARNASLSAINQAYRKRSLVAHPDKGGDIDTFNRIKKAYDTLSNVDERAAYDQLLAVTPAQREAAINALNSLMQDLQDEKNKDLDVQMNKIRHVLTLPLPYQSKKDLRFILKELESIKQLEDFNIELNNLDIDQIKQIINRNQELVNTTELKFGYTPLITILAKKDITETDLKKQRMIFKYLLSVSGIDVHKMSATKDPKDSKNALDEVVRQINLSKNNKALDDHYRKMAKKLIDRGVELKRFAHQPKAQELVAEIRTQNFGRLARERARYDQLQADEARRAEEENQKAEAARIAQLRAEEEAARLAELKAEEEAARLADEARRAQLRAEEADRLAVEKAAQKAKIDKDFAATFQGAGLYQGDVVGKVFGELQNKMEAFKQQKEADRLAKKQRQAEQEAARLAQLKAEELAARLAEEARRAEEVRSDAENKKAEAAAKVKRLKEKLNVSGSSIHEKMQSLEMKNKRAQEDQKAEAARIALLNAEKEAAQRAEEAQRLADEEAAAKAKINKDFGVTFSGKGLHKEGAVGKVFDELKDKMQTFRQSNINNDLERCVKKLKKEESALAQLHESRKVLMQQNEDTQQKIQELESRINNLRNKIKLSSKQLKRASSRRVAA